MKHHMRFRYLRFYSNQLGFSVYYATIFSLIAILLDALGISIFIPVLANILSNGGEIQLPKMLSFLNTEKINFWRHPNNQIFVIYFIIGIFLLKAFIQFLHGAYIAKLKSNLSSKLRINYLNQYSKTSYKLLKTLNSGYLVGLLGEQTFKISTSVLFFLQFTAMSLSVCIYVLIGALFAPNIGLYIGISSLGLFLIYRHINKKIVKHSLIFTKNSNKFASRVLQLTRNIKYLVSTNSINTYEDLARFSAIEAASNDRKIGILSAFSTSIKEPLIIALITVVIYFESIKYGKPGADILLSVVFFYRGFTAAISCQNFYQRFLESTGAIEEYLESYNNLQSNINAHQGNQFPELSDRIELIDVSVLAGGNKLLDDINLTIKRKENIGIMGESGAGKSTLLNVLTLLQPIDGGSISIDGADSGAIDANRWSDKIGLVSQEPVIFDGSIKDNILMEFDQKNISDEDYDRLIEVCKITEITEIINKSELGLDYPVGEGGSNLSGGQRQKLNIARELYREKEVLILDEPTSSLDSDSEKTIMAIIEKLKGAKTIIGVSHSEFFISCLDRKVEIKSGKIVSDTAVFK